MNDFFFRGSSFYPNSIARSVNLMSGNPEHTDDSIFTKIPGGCCEISNDYLNPECCMDADQRTTSPKGVMPQRKTPFGWRYVDVFHNHTQACCEPVIGIL